MLFIIYNDEQEVIMGLSYNKLWKLLIDRKMSKADLREIANISPNTTTKLNKDEPVNMTILLRICDELNCNLTEIVDYIPNKKCS